MISTSDNERPIAVNLFAGAGGMTLGFEQAGFDVLVSVEVDPIHCATHEFNFPFWKILCKNIVDTTGEEIRSSSIIGDREIDVVFGEPPYQSLLLIGKRVFDDLQKYLIYHYIRLVLDLQPKFFVLENIKGITVGKQKEIISAIINQFEQNGYKTRKDYKILNAAEYGVPQNRERLFLLGCRQDLELPNYPAPISRPAKSHKANLNKQLPLSPTVWDALQDLPEVEDYIELFEQDWVIADFGKPSDYGRKLRGLCSIDNDYSYTRTYDSRILTSSLRTKHTPESIKRFGATPPGKIEPVSRFYKLSSKGICKTLKAGTVNNKGALTSARPIHPIIPRCITVREAARLHSYPDWFRFHVTKWYGFRQVGDSVPPLLAKAVAAEIMKALGKEPFKPGIIQELGKENLLKFDISQAAEYYGVEPYTE